MKWQEKLDNSYVVWVVLIDLPKGFDCISHHFIIARLAGYALSLNDIEINAVLSY